MNNKVNRRKKLRRPVWVLNFILLVGVIIGIGLIMQDVRAGNNDEKETFKVSSSTYPGLNIETRTKEAKHYTMSISSPLTNSEEINIPIQKWIKEQETEFLDEVKANQITLQGDHRGELNIKVDTNKINDHMYSLVFTSSKVTGGANGNEVIKSFNINTAENKILALSDVMTLDKSAIDHIITIVKKDLQNQKDVAEYVFDEYLQEVLESPSQWKWSLSNKAFSLYFDKFEIAAGAAGSIHVNIPLESLRSYMDEELLKEWDILKKDDTEKETEAQKPNLAPLDPKGKYVALTFDDGPHPKVTPRVLKTLKKYDAKATFFMLGVQVEYYPKMAKKVAAAGHEIGNHSESHPNLANMNLNEVRKEITKASDRIESATGAKPTLFRPPYGAINDAVRKVVKEQKTPIILWSVDSLDWKSKNAQAVNKEVMKNVRPGSIILMHDIHSSTADALPQLLESLKKQGYQFVTVSQLLSLNEFKGIGPYYNK
ncbi:polysaccharide deacetylase family protein [Paenibacillus sp. GCM10028914]|uniref:polysaccharide deacetylase family protein n=1 Tax=Paenibacillus sp. GCM10028914 TaxID=3273416 RepID=UPI00360B4E09